MFRAVLAATLAGVFSLFGGTPRVTASLSESSVGTATHVTFWQTDEATHAPVRTYDVDMTNLLHMIVVRDDLQTFDHVHPRFDAQTGRFTVTVAASPLHRYYVYTDSQPHGAGQQVFRFVIHAKARASAQQSFAARAASVAVDGYRVTLAGTQLPADRASELDIHITRNGRDAAGLKPYLGAPAHVVFINTKTLEYAHVHPTLAGVKDDMDMPMAGMPMATETAYAGPHLTAHLPALPAGTYRLWLQFAGPDAIVHTAPFTVVLH